MQMVRLVLWLGGLAALAASSPSYGQSLTAAMQALPTKQVVQTTGENVDSALYQQTAALRAHLFRQAAPVLKRRNQYFWQGDSTKWVYGHLYRIPIADCQYMIIGLEDLLDGFVLTLTPAGEVIDAYQVAEFEPEYWLYHKRLHTFQGRVSYTEASKFTCAGFQTEHIDYRINRQHSVTSTTHTFTRYRITAAGKIQLIASPPTSRTPKHRASNVTRVTPR